MTSQLRTSPAPEAQEGGDGRGPLSEASVLVVDGSCEDPQEFEKLVAERCSTLDVMVVRSVEAVRNLLGASHFDAVLSSVELSDGTVLDVLAVADAVPVIVLASEGEEDLAARALTSGAAAHVVCDSQDRFVEMLAAVVDSVVRHTGVEEQLRRHKEQLEEAVEQRTAILRAEIADRRRAENEKALMLDSTADLVVYHDLDLRVAWANKEAGASVGEPPEQLVGRFCWEIWHGRDAECEGCPVVLARDTGRPQRAEIRSPDGRCWDIRGYPVKGPDNKVIGVTEFCLDTTDAKRAEAELIRHREQLEELVEERTDSLRSSNLELKAANRALELVSASVSHDLKAPLRAVSGYSQILLEDNADTLGSDDRRMLETMCRKTRRMGELVEQLLWFTRVGRRELRCSQVDMTSLASRAVSEVRGSAGSHVLHLQVAQLPPAYGDASMLRQVLTNLIDGVARLMWDRGGCRLELGGRVEDDVVVYFIREDCETADTEWVEKLLSLVDGLETAEGLQEAALGVAIAQRVVQRHGGRVWVDGESDRGAEICFSIPRA